MDIYLEEKEYDKMIQIMVSCTDHKCMNMVP